MKHNIFAYYWSIVRYIFYKEPFDKIQSISFLIIWVGLVVFTMGEGKRERRVRIEDKT